MNHIDKYLHALFRDTEDLLIFKLAYQVKNIRKPEGSLYAVEVSNREGVVDSYPITADSKTRCPARITHQFIDKSHTNEDEPFFLVIQQYKNGKPWQIYGTTPDVRGGWSEFDYQAWLKSV